MHPLNSILHLRPQLRRYFRPSLVSQCIHTSVPTQDALDDLGLIPIEMPALSPTMTQGNLAQWHKKEGDELAPGDVLCDVETDKTTVGFEYQDEGVLAKILLEDGSQDVAVGTTIALAVEDSSDLEDIDFSQLDLDSLIGGGEKEASTEKAPAAVVEASQSSSRTPLIQFRHGKREMEKVSDLTQTITTTTSPVIPEVTPVSTPVVATGERSYRDIPLTQVRKIIAQRLTESKTTVPHLYGTATCNIGPLIKLRKSLKSKAGANISVNDFIVKAVALSLKQHPVVNSYFCPQTKTVKEQPSIDVCIAVATDGGLLTPIVPNADQMTVTQLNSKAKDLAKRAREGTLLPEEFQGGSFTVSNLGMFGIKEFSAVINPPQSCIMAVGGGTQFAERAGGDDNLVDFATKMTVRLSADRRVCDEASLAAFLDTFQQKIEFPESTLI